MSTVCQTWRTRSGALCLIWRVDGPVLGEKIVGPFCGTARLADGSLVWAGGWPTIASCAGALRYTVWLNEPDERVIARRVWGGAAMTTGALTAEALAYLSMPGAELDMALGGRFWYAVAPGLPLRQVDGRAVAALLRSDRLKPATRMRWDERRGAAAVVPSETSFVLAGAA